MDSGHRPKLCIVIAIDGARGEYLEGYEAPWVRKLAAPGVGFRNAISQQRVRLHRHRLTTSRAGIKQLGLIGEPLNLLSRELFTEGEVSGLPEHRDVAPLMLRLFGSPKE